MVENKETLAELRVSAQGYYLSCPQTLPALIAQKLNGTLLYQDEKGIDNYDRI